MRRRSTPASSRWVAKLCLRRCGYTSLGELGRAAGLGANMGHAVAGDRLGDAVPRKEPRVEVIELPGAPQEREQVGGEHHEAIALALALAHVDHHPLGVNVGALELTEFGDADAGGVEGGQDHAMFQVAWREQQGLDLVTTENDGERLGLLGVRNVVDHPRTAQGSLVEKAEGTDRLNERAPGRLLLRNEELLVGADVVRT